MSLMHITGTVMPVDMQIYPQCLNAAKNIKQQISDVF